MNLLYAKALPGISVAKLEQSLKKALDSFDGFLTPARMERIKMLYLASQWGTLRNPQDLATQLSGNLSLTRNALYEFDLLKRIQKVTLEEVQARFKVFKSAAKTRVILNPADKTKPIEEGLVSSFFSKEKVN